MIRYYLARKYSNGAELYNTVRDYAAAIVFCIVLLLAFGIVGGIESGTMQLPF